MIDLIFIDDYSGITKAWVLYGLANQKNVAAYNSINSFTADMDKFDLATPIYIDSDLNNDIKGEDFAKELYQHGFKNIYLCTGHSPQNFSEMFWIKEIVGKEPPF